MEGIQVEEPRGYRICAYTNSNEGEIPKRFNLDIRLNGKNFSIHASPANFQNSPSRTKEFDKYFEFLASGAYEDEEDKHLHGDAEHDAYGVGDVTIDKCFDWTVGPFLPVFRSIAPQPTFTSSMTLQHFLASESFECELLAIDDRLLAGAVDFIGSEEYLADTGGFQDEFASPWTTIFPSFHPSQVEIIGSGKQCIFDEEPRLVLVNNRECFFKSFDVVGEPLGRKEVQKHEQIAQANFGVDVQTSRLFGIVQDEQDRPRGLLLEYIEEHMTLADAVGPETPQSSRDRWTKQIQHSLAALHGAGIVWGDAKADNIIIDIHSNAWIIDFGGGHTEGWTNRDNAGTVEGDIQALTKILQFISTGQGDN